MTRCPELAGISEIATILGVSKQRAHQLAADPRFPRPVARLRATPVWLAADVRHFGEEREARRVMHSVRRSIDIKSLVVCERACQHAHPVGTCLHDPTTCVNPHAMTTRSAS